MLGDHSHSIGWNKNLPPKGPQGFSGRLKIIIAKESIASFARGSGISQASIRKYLHNNTLPSIDKIAAIAKYTERSLAWLIMGEEAEQISLSNTTQLKEIEAGWDYIFQSLTFEEKYRVILTFNRGGLQALFAEGILDT